MTDHELAQRCNNSPPGEFTRRYNRRMVIWRILFPLIVGVYAGVYMHAGL